MFLILAFIENFVLLSTGIVGLDRERYDSTFIIVSVVLCTLSYIIGVVLHSVYYGCFGHPWVDINGPNLSRDHDENTWVLSYYKQNNISKWAIHSCCKLSHHTQDRDPTDKIYIPASLQLQMKLNGTQRQVKDL